MTNEKARDFFSAYFEGSLDAGLSLSLQQKLKADDELRADYQAFVRAMDSLDILKFEQIEIPHDLHERISARLDRHLYDQKANARPSWSTWIRGFAFAGIGVVAILGAMLALRGTGDGTQRAGFDFGSSRPQLSVAGSPEGVTLQPAPGTSAALRITDEHGKVVNEIAAANPADSTRLTNALPNAAVFGIQFGKDRMSYVALPGTKRSGVVAGEGTLVDFAKALADFYRIPVKLDAPAATANVRWSFEATDAVTDAGRALGGSYRVTLLKDLLEIEHE